MIRLYTNNWISLYNLISFVMGALDHKHMAGCQHLIRWRCPNHPQSSACHQHVYGFQSSPNSIGCIGVYGCLRVYGIQWIPHYIELHDTKLSNPTFPHYCVLLSPKIIKNPIVLSAFCRTSSSQRSSVKSVRFPTQQDLQGFLPTSVFEPSKEGKT